MQGDAPKILSEQERLARLRLSRSDHVGPITFRHLIARYQSGEAALDALPELAKRGGKRTIKIYPKASAMAEIDAARTFGAKFIILGDTGYPEPLAAIEDAPPVLIVKGHLHLLQKPAFGIVGARNASAAGLRFARTIAAELGQEDLIIASGMARGIDAAAHQGALMTGTIAVLGGGVDVVYPKENQALYEEITERGLLISEVLLGTQPQARHFPRRNRIISGLSLGVLVVEAAQRSGSLISARLAGEQGREVFAVPGSPLDPRCKGPNSLIRDGATLVEDKNDVLKVINAMRGRPFSDPAYNLFDMFVAESGEEGVTPALRDGILEKLSPTPVPIDELVRLTGESAGRILTVLLELELAGLAVRHPGNKIALSDADNDFER